eukprot:GHVH01007039.1.p2 GENE.GHVH01007039.1~~GHVH01007039.1.p2  ORF type:complete len:110 (+),score=21.42 GHVH01007039.1:636-965(+)
MAAGGSGMKYSSEEYNVFIEISSHYLLFVESQKSKRHCRKDKIVGEKKKKANQKKYRKAAKDHSVKGRFKRREKIPNTFVGKKALIDAAHERKQARDAMVDASSEEQEE